MIPISISPVNYQSIKEADDKADRDRQHQLKVSDDKRRRMKAILNENTIVRFNNIKNRIHQDQDPILHSLKASYFEFENELNENNLSKITVFNDLIDQIPNKNISNSDLKISKKNEKFSDVDFKNDAVKIHSNNENNLSSVQTNKFNYSIENKLTSLEAEWLDVFEKEGLLVNNNNISSKDTAISMENNNGLIDLYAGNKIAESNQELTKEELNLANNFESRNLQKNLLENSNLNEVSFANNNSIDSELIGKISNHDGDGKVERSVLQSMVADLENIILNSKFKVNSQQILLALQNIEKNFKLDNPHSLNLSPNDLNELSCQFDFLEGYLQSGGHANEIQNKILDTLNASRSHLVQIANNNLLEKDKDLSVIENNPMLLGNAALVMSPQLLNLPNNKNSSDNAMNKNNQINGIARLQQKNKDETLPLAVLRSI
jgi:hypothetical protein